MKKTLFIIVLVFIGLNTNEVKGQEVDCWFNINFGISSLNMNKDLMNHLSMNKKPEISGIVGVDFGATFKNNLELFLNMSLEGASKQFNNKTIQIDVDAISLNVAYPFLRKDKFSLYGRVGFGWYDNYIQFGEEVASGLVYNLDFIQRFNLFVPIGLTLKMPFSQRTSTMISLIYRYSIDTGITKQFGSDIKFTNFPFIKLNGFVLNIGYSHSI
jgi:hypothetical protein